MRRLKIKGHIENLVNETTRDGEKICHLLLDEVQAKELLEKLPKELIVWDMDNDDAKLIDDKYKQHDYAGYAYASTSKITHSVAPAIIK